jgi:hypothetical protein
VPPARAAAPPIIIKEILRATYDAEAADTHRRALLLQTPEVSLHAAADWPRDAQAARQLIVDTIRKARAADAQVPDGFIRGLMKERRDLAGLPFLLGKECQTAASSAAAFGRAAAVVRELADEDRSRNKHSKHSSPYDVPRFWRIWTAPSLYQRGVPPVELSESERGVLLGHGIAALTQILGPADAATRLAVVEELAGIQHALAAQALAKFALYDLDAQVRDRAIVALGERDLHACLPHLLEGFRHPWPVIAENAAAALVKVDWREAAPALIDLLDAPDPRGPVTIERDGKKVQAVRELVRINHQRNCQLCHAPSNGRDPVMGLVPSPAEPLPPSLSRVYYGGRNQDMVVRADITYLRQDFSAMLPVKDAKPWPEQQRFDFVVRTRILDEGEAAVLAHRPRAPQHDIALRALRELTGADFGIHAANWREALPTPTALPAHAPRASMTLP